MSPTSPILLASRSDERYADARTKRSGETYYVIPGSAISATSTQTQVIDRDVYEVWFTPTPIVVDQMAFEVTTLAAGNARIGFYRADRDWQPYGAPLADSGDIATGTTGVKTYTPSTPVAVRPGRYLSVTNFSATPTIRVFRGGLTFLESGLGASSMLLEMRFLRTYAPFPTPPSAWDLGNATNAPMNHKVIYRVSQP